MNKKLTDLTILDLLGVLIGVLIGIYLCYLLALIFLH